MVGFFYVRPGTDKNHFCIKASNNYPVFHQGIDNKKKALALTRRPVYST